MEQQLSDSMKAVLIKTALELKKLGWKSDSQTNEIDIYQGHLGMYKNTEWRGNNDLPNVQIDISLDLSLDKNEQNGVYFLVFNESYSLFVEGVGSSEKQDRADLSTDFSESDVNNVVKFQQSAKELNGHVQGKVEEYGYDFAQESYDEWKDYHESGTARVDQSEPWKN